MPTVTIRARARRDLIEHFVYLNENTSADAADRFLINAEASFNDLAQQPLMGAPLTLQHPDLIGMRKWRVMGFDHFLIFYFSRSTRSGDCARTACSAGLVELAWVDIVAQANIEG